MGAGGVDVSSQEWKNENAMRYNLLIKKESDVYKALQAVCIAEKCKPTSYIQIALREKLIRDGYMSQSDGKEKSE